MPQLFENLTAHEARSTSKAIRWTPATKRTIYRSCARDRLGQHALDPAIVGRLMILLGWHDVDDALYEALAKKLIRFLTTHLAAAKKQGAYTERLDPDSGRYVVIWRAYTDAWGQDDYDVVVQGLGPPEGDPGAERPSISRAPLSAAQCLARLLVMRREGDLQAPGDNGNVPASDARRPSEARTPNPPRRQSTTTTTTTTTSAPTPAAPSADQDMHDPAPAPPTTETVPTHPQTHPILTHPQTHPVLHAIASFLAERYNRSLPDAESYILHNPLAASQVIQELSNLCNNNNQPSPPTPDNLLLLTDFHHQLDTKTRTIQALEDVLTTTRSQFYTREARISDLEAQLQQNSRQLDHATHRLAAAEDKAAVLQTQNDELSHLIVDDRVRMSERDEQIRVLQDQVQRAGQWEARCRAVEEEAQRRYKEAEKKAREAWGEVGRLEGLLRRVDRTCISSAATTKEEEAEEKSLSSSSPPTTTPLTRKSAPGGGLRDSMFAPKNRTPAPASPSPPLLRRRSIREEVKREVDAAAAMLPRPPHMFPRRSEEEEVEVVGKEEEEEDDLDDLDDGAAGILVDGVAKGKVEEEEEEDEFAMPPGW